jgi:hypothetical protein
MSTVRNRIAKAVLSEAPGDTDNSSDNRIVTPYHRWTQGVSLPLKRGTK